MAPPDCSLFPFVSLFSLTSCYCTLVLAVLSLIVVVLRSSSYCQLAAIHLSLPSHRCRPPPRRTKSTVTAVIALLPGRIGGAISNANSPNREFACGETCIHLLVICTKGICTMSNSRNALHFLVKCCAWLLPNRYSCIDNPWC